MITSETQQNAIPCLPKGSKRTLMIIRMMKRTKNPCTYQLMAEKAIYAKIGPIQQ